MAAPSLPLPVEGARQGDAASPCVAQPQRRMSAVIDALELISDRRIPLGGGQPGMLGQIIVN